ncbi:hypothetical protein [Acidithiobacillus ferrooxidans]|uniref:hypothetical protein n=1 Tax=Acidithiobacillus ferrooxidans TaxID=920 RepID=UPI000B118446|nr:hypothetical protein [Acidithiobacillus ferrooxidans]
MRRILRTLSAVGLISLSVNAWADTAGGFNSILQAASSGPAMQAGKLPVSGVAIKGLPASLGGQKSPMHAATPMAGPVKSLHPQSPTLPAHKAPALAPAKTAAPATTAASPATISHPPMPASAPQAPVAQAPRSVPTGAVKHGPRQNMPQAMTGQSAPSTPMALPSSPQTRMPNPLQGANPVPSANPLQAAIPSPAASPAATGYINPFVGQPGVIEKLSNRLAVVKLKNALAKAEATGAKYRAEYTTLSQNNSPQMQALSRSVNQMKARLAQLESRHTAQVRLAQAVQKKKAHPSMVLVGILHNDGDKYALLQVGKHLLTLSKGGMAGNATLQFIGRNSIQLSNGEQLRVSSNGVGHYAATSWKGTQAGGGIIPPQSSVSAGLMREAQQAGIPLPGAAGQAPSHNGAQMIHFPTPGIRP